MSTNRYQHLKPRVKASGMAYHSSIASRSKRDEKMQKEAEEMQKKKKEWADLSIKQTAKELDNELSSMYEKDKPKI